ncbi:uncharacterized protein LOC126903782 [Daktulosphaira vitifoliae]|uniref:uncharacterized protein LOC126903782 n=1 Tax=Daktulosphaira vitifoliae TaxID=58002 RepID=UPI0021AA360A|nr:uncharacterized protein LOC126903782 [Daktulosphaira vitifoliae]
MLERKSTTKFIGNVIEEANLLDKFSSLNKILRIMTYCLRFIDIKVNKTLFKTSVINADDLNRTNINLIRIVQNNYFAKEISCLINGKEVSKKSKLLRLRPFLDDKHLIRFGGRLKNALSIDECQRHPIVLLGDKCKYARLLFLREHERLMNGGPQAMLSTVRLNYWPLNARRTAKGVLHHCIKCFRYRPVVIQRIMGLLPISRFKQGRAFLISGCDFAGQLMIKDSLRKRTCILKCYACIFICFSTKAVHIELVSDLSTKSFLNALDRFFNRRGIAKILYSDNATNFVGANKYLKEVYDLFQSEEYENQLIKNVAEKGVEWRLIPARSPHFGGL